MIVIYLSIYVEIIRTKKEPNKKAHWALEIFHIKKRLTYAAIF